MAIKFGPAGLGPVQEAVNNLEMFHKLGIKACEIAFTYGIYIKRKEDIKEIRKAAEKFGIELSIHAPYWINLNSVESEKVRKSKERILKCCEIGHLLGAKKIVFHPGYYSGMEKEKAYENIKNALIEMQEEIKKNSWDVKLAPETTGKVNVFGTVEEILNLVKDTKCTFTIDFAHLFARHNGKISYKEITDNFKEFDNWHCHFSGIIYSNKGERSHKITPDSELKKLLEAMPKNKNIILINESPDPLGDSIKALNILKSKN